MKKNQLNRRNSHYVQYMVLAAVVMMMTIINQLGDAVFLFNHIQFSSANSSISLTPSP